MAERNRRPILISILAIFIFSVGILCLIGGTLCAMGLVEEYREKLDMTKEVMALVFIGIGTAHVAMAGGLWDGWKLAWYVGVLIIILLMVSNATLAVTSSPWFLVEIPFGILILLYLLRPGVKEYFKHRCQNWRTPIDICK
jgi:hypothetical protein